MLGVLKIPAPTTMPTTMATAPPGCRMRVGCPGTASVLFIIVCGSNNPQQADVRGMAAQVKVRAPVSAQASRLGIYGRTTAAPQYR
jgi:hypothetical protein